MATHTHTNTHTLADNDLKQKQSFFFIFYLFKKEGRKMDKLEERDDDVNNGKHTALVPAVGQTCSQDNNNNNYNNVGR